MIMPMAQVTRIRTIIKLARTDVDTGGDSDGDDDSYRHQIEEVKRTVLA